MDDVNTRQDVGVRLSNIHARITHWRRAAGLRQVELANAICMSASVVSRWESGSADPSLDALELIAEACGLSWGEFAADFEAAE